LQFASSEWCQWEVDVVQERRRRQGQGASVLIMPKAIDADHMTSAIRTLQNTTPYLRYRKGIHHHNTLQRHGTQSPDCYKGVDILFFLNRRSRRR
jgi:hypothetical protein